MAILDGNFEIAYISGYSLSTILHSIGLYLLISTKGLLENQRIVTINLAVSELCSSVYQVIMKIIENHSGDEHDLSAFLIDACFSILLFSNIRFVFIHLLLDRFLDIHLNIKYTVYFTKARLIMIVCGVWTFCAVFAITMTLICKYVTGFSFLKQFFGFTFFLLDVLIVVLAVITYSYMFMKVNQIMRSEMIHFPAASRARARKTTRQKFMIPCLMVLTYVLLNVTAEVIIMIEKHVNNRKSWNYAHNVAHLLIILGWISDSVIYIFAQRGIRKKLKKTWFCKKVRNIWSSFIKTPHSVENKESEQDETNTMV